jgi:hypothetical protein
MFRKHNDQNIGLTWTELDAGKQGGAVLKMSSKSQWRAMLDSLANATGKKAINTDLASGGK